MPYLGRSRVYLPSIWELIADGCWPAEDGDTDTEGD